MTSSDDTNTFSKIFAGYIDSDESDIEPFTMKQVERPVLFVLCLYGMALTVFLMEFVFYKWKSWRGRKFSSSMESQ